MKHIMGDFKVFPEGGDRLAAIRKMNSHQMNLRLRKSVQTRQQHMQRPSGRRGLGTTKNTKAVWLEGKGRMGA